MGLVTYGQGQGEAPGPGFLMISSCDFAGLQGFTKNVWLLLCVASSPQNLACPLLRPEAEGEHSEQAILVGPEVVFRLLSVFPTVHLGHVASQGT